MSFRYDSQRNAWFIDDAAAVNPTHMMHFIRYGQPYNPSDPNFNHSHFESQGDKLPTLIFDNQNAMAVFGSRVNLEMFDVVKNFRANGYSLNNGTYTFDDLLDLGFATGGIYGDNILSLDLYGTSRIDIGHNLFNSPKLAFVFGSVQFELDETSRFTVYNGEITIQGGIRVVEDNFDYISNNFLAKIANPLLRVLQGEQNFQKVILLFEGEGSARKTIAVETNPFCFPADTPVMTPGGDIQIAAVAPGDTVLAPDAAVDGGRGELVEARVVRVLRNVTPEWLKLVPLGEAEDGAAAIEVPGAIRPCREETRDPDATYVTQGGTGLMQ